MSLQKPPIWPSVFDHIYEQLTPATRESVNEVLAPMTQSEVAAVVADLRNPWPPSDPHFATYTPLDPSKWLLPHHPLPPTYVDFLEWSDGATWQTGEREFSCFGCKHLREYLLHYHFPEYMSGALPIGSDGGGVFGVFDLRNGSSDAVWAIGAGALDWDEAVKVAGNFQEFCLGTTSVGDEYSRGFAARIEERAKRPM